jgi:hypothetical protein
MWIFAGAPSMQGIKLHTCPAYRRGIAAGIRWAEFPRNDAQAIGVLAF